MHWNNRIFYNPDTKTYSVHETYYDETGLKGFTTNPISGEFESVDELIRSHQQIAIDVSKPDLLILDYKMEDLKAEGIAQIEDEEDTYKCVDIQLINVSSVEFNLFEVFLCWNDIFTRRALIAISWDGGFKIEQLLFFNISK